MKIRIKCPVCGAILEVVDNPANYEKNVTCPNCKQKNKFKAFKRIIPAETPAGGDETQIEFHRDTTPGYLLDKTTGRRYALNVGRQLVGRKPQKTPPKADIPIETKDPGMSREHLYLDVMKGRDGHYHIYASNAKNLNPTYINDAILKDGDKVGIKHGDILRLCDTPLQYVGNVIDDETTL